MGLDQVIEEIRREGKREAEAIVNEATQEAEAIKQEAEQKAQSKREQATKEAANRADAQKRRILASAELDAKKKRLDAEADVLAAIRSRVEARLRKLPEADRTRLLRSLVESSGAGAFGEGARAWALKDDRDTIEDLGFEYVGEIDCLGGCVIESPDGSVREDLRFDTIVDEVWREQMHEVATDILDRGGD